MIVIIQNRIGHKLTSKELQCAHIEPNAIQKSGIGYVKIEATLNSFSMFNISCIIFYSTYDIINKKIKNADIISTCSGNNPTSLLRRKAKLLCKT